MSALLVAAFTAKAKVAVVLGGGAGLVLGAVFAPDRRKYFLGLFTLALVLSFSKRIFILPGHWPALTDAFVVTAADALLLLMLPFWFLDAWHHRGLWTPAPRTLTAPFLILFFAFLPSFLNTEWPAWTAAELFRMMKVLGLYLFFSYGLRDMDEVRWVLGCMAAGLFFQLGVCVLQWAGQEAIVQLLFLGGARTVESFVGGETVIRAGGSFGHPNFFAYYLDLMIPLMLALTFSPTASPRRRLLFGAALFAGSVSLLLSLSRSGLLATAMSGSICFLIIAARNARLGVLRAQTRVVAVGGMLLAAALSGKVIARFLEKDAGASDNRFRQYRVAANVITAHPIVGIGLNTYKNTSVKYDDTPARISTMFKAPVHNVYLLTLAETGVVGLAALFFLVFSMLRLAWFRVWKEGGEAFDIHLGLFFGLVGYFLHANLDVNHVGSYTVVFFLMGVLTSVQRLAAREAPGAP